MKKFQVFLVCSFNYMIDDMCNNLNKSNYYPIRITCYYIQAIHLSISTIGGTSGLKIGISKKADHEDKQIQEAKSTLKAGMVEPQWNEVGVL
jgi:hypothetical protein